MDPSLTDVLSRLRDWDEDTWSEHWELVTEVVRAHEPGDVLAAAAGWCARSDPSVQAVGLDVLGELGVIFPAAREQLLGHADALRESSDSDVRWSLAVALGASRRRPGPRRCCSP